jgi:hydroxymethylglutaryl-CoA lyase
MVNGSIGTLVFLDDGESGAANGVCAAQGFADGGTEGGFPGTEIALQQEDAALTHFAEDPAGSFIDAADVGELEAGHWGVKICRLPKFFKLRKSLVIYLSAKSVLIEAAVKIIECPRDAMQGISTLIPTEKKVAYLNQLLKVGFHTLDCGSFVSPKAIPQMRDTSLVIPRLELKDVKTRLSVVVGNGRGAEQACEFDEIQYIGYPFSVSETFQLRNTNCDFEASMLRVEEIQNICECHGKEMVVYISMAFGNPYGDLYDPVLVEHWVERLMEAGITWFSISDTIGVATPGLIERVVGGLNEDFPEVGFGCHFHTTPDTWREKVDAAWRSGCKRFDGAIKGFGGCPMAKDDLTGNMPTEKLISYFDETGVDTGLNKEAFEKAMQMAAEIFPT